MSWVSEWHAVSARVTCCECPSDVSWVPEWRVVSARGTCRECPSDVSWVPEWRVVSARVTCRECPSDVPWVPEWRVVSARVTCCECPSDVSWVPEWHVVSTLTCWAPGRLRRWSHVSVDLVSVLLTRAPAPLWTAPGALDTCAPCSPPSGSHPPGPASTGTRDTRGQGRQQHTCGWWQRVNYINIRLTVSASKSVTSPSDLAMWGQWHQRAGRLWLMWSCVWMRTNSCWPVDARPEQLSEWSQRLVFVKATSDYSASQ